MSINSLLLQELDAELAATRKILERVPSLPDYAPHPKSMPLGKLGPHVAQLPLMGLAVLGGPGLDFATMKHEPLEMESGPQLVAAFDALVAQLKDLLGTVPEAAWSEPWTLSWGGKELYQAPRFVAYRQMFMNHLVHHRAQVGTYLRQSGVPVPSTYGPSADEQG